MNAPMTILSALLQRIAIAALGIGLVVGTLALAGSWTGTTAAADAQTQSQDGPATAGRHRMADALMSLGLSDAQKSQIRGIMRDARVKSRNADPQTRRANFRAAMTKVNAVLTPDQERRFRAKMADMRRQRGYGSQSQS